VVCVIGDGAMSAGMAYEALNNAGALRSRLVVISERQRDVDRARRSARCRPISPASSRRTYRSIREVAKRLARKLPRS
jgi:1-deoxy-D-xylulose-5-phosphate synthase